MQDGFENKYQNKLVETLEQIGRFTCFGTMIINIPHTIFGSGGIRKMNEQKFSGKGGVHAKARRDYLGGVRKFINRGLIYVAYSGCVLGGLCRSDGYPR